MKDLKIVPADELHNTIRSFIIDSQAVIGDYEDMKSLILKMIKSGHMFNMNRDRLRDAMEDLTFMLCPGDDANKDRVERGLEYDDDDDTDDDSDDMEFSMRSDMDDPHQQAKVDQDRPEKQVDRDDTIEDIGNISELN